jgi:twinkle protein
MKASRFEAMAMAGNQRSARSVRQTAKHTTGASDAWWFTSTAAVSASPAFTADGSKHGFMMKGNGMLARHQLSDEHAQWLEAERKIPSELAANLGVVSRGENLAFEYRQNGVVSFAKIRREVLAEGKRTKTYWIEPKGSALCLWNEDCLSDPSDAPLIITEGEPDALSFLAAGATHVVSVPNGSPFDKPGIADINPADDRAFCYLWDGCKLKPGLQRFNKVILATDGDQKGRVLRDELAVRLGRSRCWYVEYPAGTKDANEVLVTHGAGALQRMIADAKPMVPSRLVPFSEIPSRADDKRFSAGWSEFDPHLMVVPPQLIVVTGKPNHGKTEWVTLGLCANLARLHCLKGAILQFEDNPERNRRALIRYAKAWAGQRFGVAGDPVEWFHRMFLSISPNEDLNEDQDFDLKWLQDTIEEAATRHACRWVLIDPWNEIEHLWGRQDTEATYLNRALKYIKRLARRFQIAIIIVAHPTKEGGKVPSVADASLYDINGGAVWNNKADLGVIVWADDVSSPDRWVKVAKSKDFIRFGQPGTVRMRFNAAHSTFSVISKGA